MSARQVAALAVLPALAACVAALLAANALAQTAPQPREPGVVTVAALSDAIAPATLDAFARETGLRLVLDAFETPAAVEAAVGRGAYDVAVLSGAALARLQEAGKLAPLDAAAAQLDPALARLAPGGAVLAFTPWGIALDAKRARERLGERALDSWEQALRPEIWKAFSDCGAALPDEPEAMLAAAALALKLDPQSRRPADLRRAAERLTALRASAKGVASPAAIAADLAAGELCLAPLPAAEAARAAARARAAGEEAEIVFLTPKDGAPVSLDAVATLRAGAHPAAAAAFVEIVLRPDHLARAALRSRYAVAAPAARAALAAEIAQEPTLAPDAAKLFAPAAMDAPTQAQVARDWARIKIGK